MRTRALLSGIICLTTMGCLRWLPAPTPMTAVRQTVGAHPRCLIVLLPGLGDGGERFRKEGIFALLAERGLSAQVVAADASLGYYARGTLATRLEADVVAPLLPAHFQHVFIWGISMGGWGALWFAHEHPERAEGLLLLSPYLGRGGVPAEVDRAGGLAAWKGPERAPQLTEENNEREIWRWLQAVQAGRETGPAIALGHGDRDRGMEAMATLARALPGNQVLLTPGSHDWPTWRALVKAHLASGALDRACAEDGSR